MRLRKSTERGNADHGWLKSKHTFSFADYHEPKHMGFRDLRVINEDRIQGGTGFGAHGHRDMEIISYVVSGSLQHNDSIGTKAVILPGEVQRMSAGSGVTHSEMNNEPAKETHFFQIWVMPKDKGIQPGYDQKSFEIELNSKKLVLVVSGDGRDGSIGINQDADLYIARLKAKDSLEFKSRAGRGVWIQVVRGEITVQDSKLQTGDALALEDEATISIAASESSEFMLFDLV